GHPAFVAGNIGRDAERKTFLAQEGIAAITGAVGPDLARFRKMDNVLFFVAGPCDVFLAWLKRSAHRMHAGNNAFLVLINLCIDGETDARHDAHVDDDVWRVSELHTDLGHWRTDGPHAERQHIHCSAAHGTVEKL